ncbi:MAG TPA: hypothetical protein VFA32_17570 [Dehalococcoidia bacterium]|jgi:hypothetical protein|nr:hypothetical protein [Dehalococcoidia bacterium]
MAYIQCSPGNSSRQSAHRQFERFWPSPHRSSFSSDPISFIIETLIASEPVWSGLPGLAPLFLSLSLDALEEVEG